MQELKENPVSNKRTNSLEKPLLREVAYEQLKTAIQTGDLRPGEPLYELHLSEKLEISRTPIRAALQQLVQEGLVKDMPNRAMMVASLSMQDVLNVLHIRSLIEPELTRLVAESASKELIDVLQSTIEALLKAAEHDDRKAWSSTDTVFHESLSKASPNILLGQMVLQMRNRMHVIVTDAHTTQASLLNCTYEHKSIVEAIASRDGQAAKDAMQNHIKRLRERFLKRLTHM